MPINKIRTFLILLILSLAFLFTAHATMAQKIGQEKNKPKKSEKEKAVSEADILSEVRFNFVVTDAEGKLLDGIKASDLKIFENEKEQKIIYFAKNEPVLHLGLIVDNSYSLKQNLPAITALSKEFAANLRDKDEGFLIRFVSSEKISVLQDWTGSGSLLSKAAEQMYVEGGSTAIIDALYLGSDKMLERMKIKPGISEKYALIVISDWEDRDSYYKLADLFVKTKGTDLQIFVIAFTKYLDDSGSIKNPSPQEKATKLAQKVSAKTGGTIYFPEPDKQKRYTLSPIAEVIMAELRAPYTAGYDTTDQKPDDKKRKLRLEVTDNEKGEKRSAVVRDGFVFPT